MKPFYIPLFLVLALASTAVTAVTLEWDENEPSLEGYGEHYPHNNRSGLKIIDMNILQSIVRTMLQGGKRMPFSFGLVAGSYGKLTSKAILPCDNLLLSGFHP